MNEKVTITNRSEIEIQGANRVIASTSKEAVVEIENSTLVISGNNLEVTKLDLENHIVKFSGTITNVKFAEKHEKTSFLKRLFK